MNANEIIDALKKENLLLENELQESTEGLLALTLELQATEDKYHDIIERSSDAIIQTDEKGMLNYVNTAGARMFGCNDSEHMIDQYKYFMTLFHDPVQFEKCYPRLMEGQTVRSIMLCNKEIIQTIRWLDCSVQPVFDKQSNIIGLDSLMRDITEEKEASEQAQLASNVFQHSPEGIMITDEKQRIIMVNPAFTRITGYTLDEIYMKSPSILSSGWHDKKFYTDLWNDVEKEGSWFGEIKDRRKNGGLYEQETTICAIKNDLLEVTHYCAIFADITERKKMEVQVKNLAYYDSLTQLPNRHFFKEKLEQSLKNVVGDNKSIALFFLDMDNFKIVNDTLGHYYGDKLLQEVAIRLQTCTRKSDTVARLGGDEFTIVLEDIEDRRIVVNIAKKISKSLNEPYIIDDKIIYSSPSVGIAFYPDDATNETELLKCADNAMYLAKEKGKNQTQFYEPSLNAKIEEYHTLETQLRTAIQNEEFSLHYQPVIDIETGSISGAEALLRWNNALLGSVSPNVFIPHAETSGFIIELGNWVISEACKNLHYIREQGHTELRISINVSAKQLRESNFVDVIQSNLIRYNIPADRFAIEVTETSLIEYIDEVLPKLQILKDQGLTLLIDDFGTGYSSMAYLKKLPLDIVKIDRTFISDITMNEDDMEITAAIIAVSHALKKKVIAEGVETKEQLMLLLSYRCDKIQGYYFYKPMPLDIFNESMKDQTSIKYKIDKALELL